MVEPYSEPIRLLEGIVNKALNDWAFDVECGLMTIEEYKRRDRTAHLAINQLKDTAQ